MTWLIAYTENGGEYLAYMTIAANEVKRIDDRTVSADGVVIQLDGNNENRFETIQPIDKVNR